MTPNRLVWSVLTLALLSGGARAAETAPTPKPRQACMADFQRLCPGVEPGGGRVMQCLKGHLDQVSDGCRSAVKAQRAANRARKAAEGQSAAPQSAAPSAAPVPASPPT